jgi:arylsulfatase A-like enzyme
MATERPNLLVVVLDTVRARSTAVDGRDTTPTIAAEGDRGTTFETAIAPTAWSLSSHASLFTGKYATEHGATLSSRYLSDDQTTLAEQLADAGYRTGIFTPNLFTSGAFNMSRGFQHSSFAVREKLFADGISIDEFILREDWDGGTELAQKLLAEARAGNVKNVANLAYGKLTSMVGVSQQRDGERKDWDEDVLRDAQRFVESSAERDEPFFGFLNVLAAHGPWEYDPSLLREIGVEPSEYGDDEEWERLAAVSEDQWPHAAGELTFDDREQEMLRHLYESWVHRADEYAEQLLDTLSEAGVRDDTVVVLTADHGESIARGDVLGHVSSLREESLRVPLVVSGPGIDTETVSDAVSLKDLYGTLLQFAGVETDAPSWFDERARGAALAESYGESPSGFEHLVADPTAVPDRFTELRRALYTAEGSVERRPESDTVLGDEELLSELDAIVEELAKNVEGGREGELSEEVSDRLERLGYV